MNGMGHLDRIRCTQVLALYQGQHDLNLKTPNHRNALCFAGLAQRPIIGQARPAIVPSHDQAKLVLKRQGATPRGGFRQLGKIAINDSQTDGLALRHVQLLNLFQNICRHINRTHMLNHQSQNGWRSFGVVNHRSERLRRQ
jgi:hypothetical protein